MTTVFAAALLLAATAAHPDPSGGARRVGLQPDLVSSRNVRLQPDQQQQSATSNEPVTMNGCVAKRVAPQDPLTFQDESGFKYRITGRNLGRYQGQRVEIIGSSPVPRRFTVRGGLFPSPNVAGRAGDLDPAREAIARQPGGSESGTGTADALPEFRVTRIRAVQGGCD